MRQQVLKALANPARIFYVPYMLAVINFAGQFLIFMVYAIVVLVITKGSDFPSPIYFLISLCGVHMGLAYFSKRDPQLGQIISAMIQLLTKKIPRKLAA